MMDKKDAGRSMLGMIWFRYKKNKLAVLGLIMMIIILLLAIFANFIVDESKVTAMNTSNMFSPPS